VVAFRCREAPASADSRYGRSPITQAGDSHVSYSLYVGGASLARESLGDAFAGVFTSPVGIALQLIVLVALVALVRVDWIALASRSSSRVSARSPKRPAGPKSAGS
jgi:hypothetical protein